MPAAILPSAPCTARPMARDAAPSTARIEVVCTPSCCSTATRPKVMMDQRTRVETKVSRVESDAWAWGRPPSARRTKRSIPREPQKVTTRITSAIARLTARCVAQRSNSSQTA